MTTTFEQACRDMETAAASTLKSAMELAKLAKVLQKAAKEGNVAAIKRSAGRLDSALDALRQEVMNAVATWPFEDGEETEYLSKHYAVELRSVAEKNGLAIYERDGNLISYPSIVRILSGDQAVRIDKKKVSTLRPSYLTDMLVSNQKKPPPCREAAVNTTKRNSPEAFTSWKATGQPIPNQGYVFRSRHPREPEARAAPFPLSARMGRSLRITAFNFPGANNGQHHAVAGMASLRRFRIPVVFHPGRRCVHQVCRDPERAEAGIV